MTALRNIAAVVEKEWRHYFGSPIAYVTFFVWTLLSGVFFALFFAQFTLASQQASMGGRGLSLNEVIVERLLQNLSVIVLFIGPMMTMRLFAEEKRQGTIELLSTAPLTDLQIVLGKFLGALAFYTALLAAALANFVFLFAYGDGGPDWRAVAAGCLGLFLFGVAFISLGLFISTLTSNQIIASILTFGAGLGFLLIAWTSYVWPSSVTDFLSYLGLLKHSEDFFRGIVDLKDVVYYLTFTLFALFLAHQSVESQRWRA